MAERDNTPAEQPSVSAADMFECEICGRSFLSRQGLRMHVTRTHKRSDDQASTRVFDVTAEYKKEERIIDMIDQSGILDEVLYRDRVQEFLPHLARELERRRLAVGPDDSLTAVFLTLFLDVN